MAVLSNFQSNPRVKTIFLSKFSGGNVPYSNFVLVDKKLSVSTNYFPSRYFCNRSDYTHKSQLTCQTKKRQRVQRLFLFPHLQRHPRDGKRQQFLVNQGYALKVITHLKGLDQFPSLVCNTEKERNELLQVILTATDADADLGTDVKGKYDGLASTVTTRDFGISSVGKQSGTAGLDVQQDKLVK